MHACAHTHTHARMRACAYTHVHAHMNAYTLPEAGGPLHRQGLASGDASSNPLHTAETVKTGAKHQNQIVTACV